MKIEELFEVVRKPALLWHLTDVTATIDMLKNKRFKLSGKDGMSFSRSNKSGYFTMMSGPDAIMLIFDGKKVYNDFEIAPFHHESGAKQLAAIGIYSSEYEDRIAGSGTYVKIPDLSIFKQIRHLDVGTRSKGTNNFTMEQWSELEDLCKTNHIPLVVVDSKKALRAAL